MTPEPGPQPSELAVCPHCGQALTAEAARHLEANERKRPEAPEEELEHELQEESIAKRRQPLLDERAQHRTVSF